MKKAVTIIAIGDAIEVPAGMFVVTATRNDIPDTTLLCGSVGGKSTGWVAYPDETEFEVVTVH